MFELPSTITGTIKGEEYRHSLESLINTLSAHKSFWVRSVCKKARERMEFIDKTDASELLRLRGPRG